jgi:hypothetical protein
MSSKFVAKAIVLSALCATGIVAQTTLANAGPLAGLPCKKALGAVVRGDDACVKIGGAYVWRRLANVNDPVTAAAQPNATTGPVVANTKASPALTSSPNVVLTDPCALLTPDVLKALQPLVLPYWSSSWTGQLKAVMNSGTQRVCSVFGNDWFQLSITKLPAKHRLDNLDSLKDLPLPNGGLFRTGSEQTYGISKGQVRIFMYAEGVFSVEPASVAKMSEIFNVISSQVS